MDYQAFIEKKSFIHIEAGFSDGHWFPDDMFDFQRDCVSWALRRGRSALFLDT